MASRKKQRSENHRKLKWDGRGKFSKGTAGGPGRKPGTGTVAAKFRDAIKTLGAENRILDIVETLLRMSEGGKRRKPNIKAIEIVLSYYFGKPTPMQQDQQPSRPGFDEVQSLAPDGKIESKPVQQ